MFPNFLPAATQQLTEATSIALAQRIDQVAVPTPLAPQPIMTTFVRWGEGGPPVLLLHGFDSSVLEFRRLQPRLAAQTATWNLDVLGFGFTDRPSEIFVDPPAIKTHVRAFWEQQIQRPVVLVGASMGGALAIDVALTYPDMVSHLVLLDSAGFAQGPDIGRFMVPPLGYLATAFLRNAGVRRRVSRQAYADPALVTPDAELCASLHLAHPRWSAALIDFTKSGGYNFLADKIAQITQPTLILWGDRDQILGTDDAAKFAAAIGHSQLVWLPDCGHVPHLEQPDKTAQAILTFLAAPP